MASIAGHLGYELAAGVAVPLASRVGPALAGGGYALGCVAAYRAAGRLESPRGDRRFAVLDGLFLSAVIGHFTSWPRVWRAGVPWLVECEGLSGRAMPAYNAILYVSGLAAVAGLAENRRGWPWGLAAPLVAVPLLRRVTPTEYRRLLEQAARRPRWWNRRLAARIRAQ